MLTLKTIDAHAAGEPLRLIVDGFPSPRGATMLEKREWVRTRADHLRRALMLEPRGHADMYGAILTEPVAPGSHAGVLFMHNEGYSTMCGHGVIAVTTIAIERGLIAAGGDGASITYDAPAGVIRARATVRAGRVERVAFQNVPSFVLHGGLDVDLRAGRSAQRDGVCRRRSRSIAMRHRYRRGHGRRRRDGSPGRRAALRAREPHRHPVQRPGHGTDDRRRVSRHRAGDRRLGMDHRRAHVYRR